MGAKIEISIKHLPFHFSHILFQWLPMIDGYQFISAPDQYVTVKLF
ncbi:MAG: hypothetical protein SPE11_12175 [Parabacteroides sp.]|nr:hypothetical protein [bacterium]MDY4528649.1 hypothetical protein [Parabacteroides sp.]MDY4846228.1 hypothetical protein [Parabacteroides sp.]